MKVSIEAFISAATDGPAASAKRAEELGFEFHVPPVNDEPQRVRGRYRDAGAHRLVFILDSPAPKVYERQREDLAKAWIG